MAKDSELFADRPTEELRAQARRLRHAAEKALTPEGMAALLYFAEKYEEAAAEREERPPPPTEPTE
jgi:hypothetical protein